MKNYKNWIIYLSVFAGSFLLTTLLIRGCKDSSALGACYDSHKLEKDLQHLLQTKDPNEIHALWKAHPLNETTFVKWQLSTDSWMEEPDFKAYLLNMITISNVQQIGIQALECDAQKRIKTIILIIKP